MALCRSRDLFTAHRGDGIVDARGMGNQGLCRIVPWHRTAI
jgi:hypothetical protein